MNELIQDIVAIAVLLEWAVLKSSKAKLRPPLALNRGILDDNPNFSSNVRKPMRQRI